MKKVCLVFTMIVLATGSLIAQEKVTTQDLPIVLYAGEVTEKKQGGVLLNTGMKFVQKR